ncbi:hypothetical protein BGZ65_005873, partial [Modicella reniformis]
MVRSVLVSLSAALLLVATAVAGTTTSRIHWEFVDANQPRTLELQLGCKKELRGIYEDLFIYAVPES